MTKAEYFNILKDSKFIPPEFRKLIENVKQIESIVKNNYLDIEYAFKKKKVLV